MPIWAIISISLAVYLVLGSIYAGFFADTEEKFIMAFLWGPILILILILIILVSPLIILSTISDYVKERKEDDHDLK